MSSTANDPTVKLRELISSVSSAVSGVSQSAIAYELAVLLRNLSEQLALPAEERDLLPVLDKLSNPELVKKIEPFEVPRKVAEARRAYEHLKDTVAEA
jgi:hypothetical protein